MSYVHSSQCLSKWFFVSFLGAICMMLHACDSDDTPTPPSPTIAQIVLSPDDEPLISMGQELQLEAEVTDSEGSVLFSPSLVWSSTNEMVLTVSSTGLMTGRAAGTATATAELGGKSQSLTFRVVDLTGTWIGGEAPDTVRYILTQDGTSVPGTFESIFGFPPITDVNTGTLTGLLTFERYEHTLTVTTEQGCEMKIFGVHEVVEENSGELILEPAGTGSLSSTNCSIQGTIDFATLRRQ